MPQVAARPRRMLAVGATAAVVLTAVTPTAASAQTPATGFVANTVVGGDQSMPAVASAGNGDFVVVWTTSPAGALGDDDGYGVALQRYLSQGFPLSERELLVNTHEAGHQLAPSVAMGADQAFVVVWASEGQDGSGSGIYGQRWHFNDGPVGGEFRVNSTTSGSQSWPRVAIDERGGFVVVWQSDGQDASGSGIYAQRYDPDGSPIGSEFRVNSFTTGYQGLPAVSMSPGGEFVVVWESAAQDGQGLGVFGQRYDSAGGPVGSEFRVNTFTGVESTSGDQGTPSVASDAAGNFVVAWESDGQDGSGMAVMAQRYDASGLPQGAEFRVNTQTDGNQENPSVAADQAGNFGVVWQSDQDGSGFGIHGTRFTASGAPRGLPTPEFAVVTSTSEQATPALATDPVGNLVAVWYGWEAWGSGTESDIVVRRFGGLRPTALEVDPEGNGVIEPNETVVVRPTWRNENGAAQTFSAALSNLAGPPGATYQIADASGDYGTVANGSSQLCTDCYEIRVSPTGPRPRMHWDATVVESIAPDSQGQQKVWTVHIGESFADVAIDDIFYRHIETLLHNGTTLGCSTTEYCPLLQVERWQMAIFIARAFAGDDAAVPVSGTVDGDAYDCSAAGTSLFSDVAPNAIECRHVHYIADRGITLGCGGDRYCPAGVVSRWEMAMFIARAMTGGDESVPETYGPDPDTGHSYSCDETSPNIHFTGDVATSDIFCRHVHYLWARGVVSGTSDTTYAPHLAVTRDQMAKFLVNAFGLTLYGP